VAEIWIWPGRISSSWCSGGRSRWRGVDLLPVTPNKGPRMRFRALKVKLHSFLAGLGGEEERCVGGRRVVLLLPAGRGGEGELECYVAFSSSRAAGGRSCTGVELLCCFSSSWLHGGGSLRREGQVLSVWFVDREFSPAACSGAFRCPVRTLRL
jgi:hypothetical protein